MPGSDTPVFVLQTGDWRISPNASARYSARRRTESLIGGSLLRHVDGCYGSFEADEVFYAQYMDNFFPAHPFALAAASRD